jgi:hypothetical protein
MVCSSTPNIPRMIATSTPVRSFPALQWISTGYAPGSVRMARTSVTTSGRVCGEDRRCAAHHPVPDRWYLGEHGVVLVSDGAGIRPPVEIGFAR